jgi:hypothetical protein
MPPKKKSKRKTSSKKNRTRQQSRKKLAKKLPKKKSSPKKKTAKRKAGRTSRASAGPKTQIRAQRQHLEENSDSSEARFSGGDSQGLSDLESVDSESVSELVDEGNTFEAGVVSGVERADDSEGKEVRTREFPEDDVPEEYLDQD